MESFSRQKRLQNTEKGKPEILNDWDRDVLERGVLGVIEHILKDFNGKLPDALVLPETSARPLMYAFRPVFQMLQKTATRESPEVLIYEHEETGKSSFVGGTAQERF